MSVEFISRLEPVLSADHTLLRRQARAVERAGFDRLLIADPDGLPESAQLASFVLHNTISLGVAVPHAVGPMAPVVAAQQFAALDQFSGGRLSVVVLPTAEPAISGGAPLDHEETFARTDEYLVLLRRLWSNEKPFDHEGSFFRLKAGHIRTKPFATAIPLVLSGLSGTALKVAGRHADSFALPAAPVDEIRQTIARVRAAAASCGRAGRIRFSLDVSPFVGETRGSAWAKAQTRPAALAARLVGTPDQVALALLDYHELGVTSFVIHGLDDAGDMRLFAEKVMPLVRRSADRHERDDDEPLPTLQAAFAAGRPGMRRRTN